MKASNKMAVDVKAYLEGLAQSAGLDETTKAAVLQAASTEKFAKQLGDDILRHQDYSRMADELRKKEGELGIWYQDVLKITADNKKAVDDATSIAERYRQQYGDLTEDGGKPLIASPANTAEVKELREALQRTEANTLGLFKVGLRVATQHLKDFNEVLDTDALAKFAVEKGLTLESAYKEFVAPRVADRQKTEMDEKLKAAREEGARDALSKHKLPTDPMPRAPHPFFDRPKPEEAPQGSRGLRDEFVQAFHEAGAKT